MKAKPRIRWSTHYRAWLCSVAGGRPYQALGAGPTPLAAYASWRLAIWKKVQF